jgi:hypothetical protein
MSRRTELLTEYPVDKAAIEEMRQAQKDLQFAGTVAEELAASHPGSWVAVYEERVAAVEKDYEMLRKKLSDTGVPMNRALIFRLSEKDEIWIFPSLR